MAVWLGVARFATTGTGRLSLLSGRGAGLALMFFNATLLPIYSGTRAEVVYTLIIALVIRVSLGQQDVRWSTLFRAGVSCVVILTSLTFLRSLSEGQDARVTPQSVGDSLADTLVFNRNFGEMPATAHIVRAIPDTLPYSHGSTIVNYLSAPIPRSMWPDKPLISPGPIIGIKVYGTARTGIPPGAVAELYWAFDIPGVIIGALLFGWLLRAAFARLYPRDGNPALVVFYAATTSTFAINAMAVSFGYAALTALISGVLVSASLIAAGGRPTSSSS